MIRSFPTTLMQDPVFRLRSPDARLVLFTLWMHPSNHLSGLFVLDLDHLALDVRLPLERSTPALRELTDHGLVLRHAPLDQLWLPRMAALLGNLGNSEAPVHKAVSKYVHGLVPSTLCHRVLDSLSIPYRNAADLPDLCAWLPADGRSVSTVTQSDTLSTRVPDRVLSGSGSGSGLDSGSGTEIPTTGIASRPVVTVEPHQPTRSEVRAAEAATRAAEKAAEKAAAKIQRDADRAAKQEADRLAKEAKRAAYEQDRADAKAKRTATTKTNGSILFAAYRDAFLRRYHTEPLRDAKTNAHFARIAKRTIEGRPEHVSQDDAITEASRVCSAYLMSSMPLYLQSNHTPGLLEKDWHKLLTEHRTGRPITPQLAHRSDADTKREEANQRFFEQFDAKLAAVATPSRAKPLPEREPTRDELEELFRR